MAKIHFLNVGHGDCTIIEHNNGNLTVIDVNNGSDDMDDKSVQEIADASQSGHLQAAMWQMGMLSESAVLSSAGYRIPLTNPVDFLKTYYGNRPIFRYIQTHPDFDHFRGLAQLRDNFDFLNFWDHPHTKQWDGTEQRTGDAEQWDAYQEFRSGSHCKVFHLHRDSTGKYWNQDDNAGGGNGLHILSPTPALRARCNEIEDWNGMSYVLEYRTGNRRVILGGDAEQTAWEDILLHYGTKRLSCDVLKASHHGRDTGYFQEAVKAMSPTHTIVSVGKKPETDASNKYRQYSPNVWSTRWKGDISLEISGDTLNWSFGAERSLARHVY